jgi:hypothetical protein
MSAPEAGGLDATLNGEDEDDFFDLQIVKHYDEEVSTPNLMDSFQNDMFIYLPRYRFHTERTS